MQARLSNMAPSVGVDARDNPFPRKNRPLVVDVDEVLIHAENRPPELVRLIQATIGRTLSPFRSKHRVQPTTNSHFDASRALFDEQVITLLLKAMSEGRPVYLASEAHQESFVASVASHLGVFTAWSAVEETSRRKTAPNFSLGLRDGFDYLGGDAIELPSFASRAIRPARIAPSTISGVSARTWAKLLRVHQYAKNALVLVPLLTAHKFALLPATTSLFAALAFSLCASSAYILNDLLDIEADRAHPTKCTRPIACGAISPAHAGFVAIVTLIAAMSIGYLISAAFCVALLGYLALTTGYSFWLKRIAIVDVVTLAILYTMRVVAGAIAIGVVVSEWLFAFSLFMFMSLALVKRYVELNKRADNTKLMARDYQADDKSMVAVLAAAAGFNALVIFTLYISSEAVRALYNHPQLLWIICPILMCWIGRTLLLAQRGLIDDDPVIFALKDRFSWIAFGSIGAIMFAAI